MRIQHNIAALNTFNALSYQNSKMKSSIEKLSTGFAINRAGDNAAGLAISEKMRGKIRGLDQASRNIQDGISLIQTAESALKEVHSLLQRGREISIQAANDTNNNDDKAALQNEIEQILDEIDGISHRTEFNTVKLLRGGGMLPPSGFGPSANPASDTSMETKEELVNALKNHMLSAPETLIKNAFGIDAPAGTDIEIKFENDSPGGTVAWVTSYVPSDGKAYGFSMTIDEADFLTGQNLWISKDRIIAHEMTHAMMAASGINWNDSATPVWFKEGTAEYLAGADERLSGSISILGSEQRVVDSISASESSSHFYSASYAAVKYLDDKIKDTSGGSKSIKDLMGILADGGLKTLDTALQELDPTLFNGGVTGFIQDFKENGANFIQMNLDLTDDGVGSILGESLNDIDVIPDGDGVTLSKDPLGNFDVVWSSSTNTTTSSSAYVTISANTFDIDGILKIQVGANNNQTMNIHLNKVTSDALGLAGADVKVLADTAISQFDKAIETISSERSRLGAYQNRLEHAYNNNTNASNNLQAAESRIRDVNMAKEMMTFTKQEILSQAANAMLSQVNQQPQRVLQLIS
jgi:flagellin